eukprot:TRINITY_DN56773_c0_g1_i1.p1 TRINITY_DN56773_c0_g1~~TRINITY_DN56773_c0_g1_i1.p1  ORF type:complete len:192 (-),score=27.81 TRINITY_DN56773_c0_g1_i1:159-734(-)
MSWVAIQGASRKPGAGDGDILNRVRLKGSASTPASTQDRVSSSSLFKPTQLVRKEASQRAVASEVAQQAQAGEANSSGLPSWVACGATLIYRSTSSEGRFKVKVTEVAEQRVTVVFQDGSGAWKRIPHSQVLARRGPLRPLTRSERGKRPDAKQDQARRRSRSPVEVLDGVDQPLEVLEDSSGESDEVVVV